MKKKRAIKARWWYMCKSLLKLKSDSYEKLNIFAYTFRLMKFHVNWVRKSIFLTLFVRLLASADMMLFNDEFIIHKLVENTFNWQFHRPIFNAALNNDEFLWFWMLIKMDGMVCVVWNYFCTSLLETDCVVSSVCHFSSRLFLKEVNREIMAIFITLSVKNYFKDQDKRFFWKNIFS